MLHPAELPVPTLIAVRPSLTRPGCLTVHPCPLPAKDQPLQVDYSQIIHRNTPGEGIYLYDVQPHIDAARARPIRLGGPPRPCASLVGSYCPTEPDIIEAVWHRVHYRPQLWATDFIYYHTDGQPWALRTALHAWLCGTAAWCNGIAVHSSYKVHLPSQADLLRLERRR